MSLTLTYKNDIGTVTMRGGGSAAGLRITAVEGLGLVTREYNAAVYSGYDGQETISSRAAARSITIAVEGIGRDMVKAVRNALEVFGQSGMLYIENEHLSRRIYCSQVQIPDVTRVLRGQIAAFAVQFLCDSPFFEDFEDTFVPLYSRKKLLETPFTLPEMFGKMIIGGSIEIKGSVSVEPVITMYYPEVIEDAESIVVTNKTTGKSIQLEYAPQKDDTVTVDIKNRRITSSINGNIINCLSDGTFLGDFVFERGVNVVSVSVGDVTSGFTIECKYNNLYSEAVIV